jgi:hypothetical protein
VNRLTGRGGRYRLAQCARRCPKITRYAAARPPRPGHADLSAAAFAASSSSPGGSAVPPAPYRWRPSSRSRCWS